VAPSKALGNGLIAVVHPDEGRGKAMEPPHVHVYDADGEVKIALDVLKVLGGRGMNRSQTRKALVLVEKQKAHLLELWHASRPTE